MPRTVVATTGASDLGRRTMERLLAEGWSVRSLDLSDESLAEHAEALDAGG